MIVRVHGLRTHDGKIPNSLRSKFKSQSQTNIWDLDRKALFFVEIMENKGLAVPKWVLINWPKIPPKFSAQFVCSSPKLWDFQKKLPLGVRSPCGLSNKKVFILMKNLYTFKYWKYSKSPYSTKIHFRCS